MGINEFKQNHIERPSESYFDYNEFLLKSSIKYNETIAANPEAYDECSTIKIEICDCTHALFFEF